MYLLGHIDDQDANLKKELNLEEYKDWFGRVAVRAVLQNDKGQIALMYVRKYNIYKLPGGGVEKEEDLASAFVREVEEETGFVAKATADIGVFVEKRDRETCLQISFCYLANVVGEGKVGLTEEESEQEFELVWVNSIDEAINLVDGNEREHYDVKFMTPRELAILKRAKEMIG